MDTDFQINGVQHHLTHADTVNDRIGEAHAIALIMATVFHEDDEAAACNGHIKGRAMDAIAFLLADAQFHFEAQLRERVVPVAVAA